MSRASAMSLDEPMHPHWADPDVAADPRHRLLTLRIALSHQTGLPNWRGHSLDGKLAFHFTPGTAYEYSGEGYGYAARFAEKKMGRSFEDLAQQLVFGPVGMTHTSFSWRESMQGHLAIPLDPQGDWGVPQVEATGQWNAANNLITTAGDYARFIASVMQGQGLDARLAGERLQPVPGQPGWDCQAEAAADCPRDIAVVFGWKRLEFADGSTVFMHTGSNGRPGGERTLAYFDTHRERGVVVLTSGELGEALYRDIVSLIDPESAIARYRWN